MPVTVLDPQTALIVIDLQKGIVALPVAHQIDPVLAQVRGLLDAFRARGLPVVLVNVAGGAPGRTEQPRRISDMPAGWTELVPQLNQQPTDVLITKRTWGAFMHTDLEAVLKSKGVTQVVIAGVSTSVGVESTARQAYELGFNVVLAINAMTDLKADAHANSISNIFPRLGETGTAAEIIDLLPTNRRSGEHGFPVIF